MRLAFAVVLALCGCRFGFGPVDTSGTSDGASTADAFGPPAIFEDAPIAGYCTPLGVTVTWEQCAIARANPAAAPAQVLFDCADSCALDGCLLFEGPKDGCSTCACNAYIKSTVICDSSGLCGAPLNGTGCMGAGGFTAAPFNCPSGVTLPETFGCVVRVLYSMNDC